MFIENLTLFQCVNYSFATTLSEGKLVSFWVYWRTLRHFVVIKSILAPILVVCILMVIAFKIRCKIRDQRPNARKIALWRFSGCFVVNISKKISPFAIKLIIASCLCISNRSQTQWSRQMNSGQWHIDSGKS